MNRSIGRPVHILCPGSIDQATGGYAFLRRIVEGLRSRGEQVTVHELPGPHPFADEEARLEADAVTARIPDGSVVLVDGLAIPAAAHALWVDRHRLRVTALAHHPLHLETGLDAERAGVLRQLESAVLANARRVIVPSRATARDVAEMGVAEDRIAVVNPGTDRAEPAGAFDPADPKLLSLATITPRKGHLTLVHALDACRDLPWHAVLAGSGTRDPAHAAAVRAAIADAGLQDRISLPGEVREPELSALWRGAALFLLPSHHEGYGMAAAEALVRGVPVVAGHAGALPEVVPAGAGALVPPGDVDALAAALRHLLSSPDRLRAAAEAAREAGDALPGWADSIDRLRSELARAVPQDRRIERIA